MALDIQQLPRYDAFPSQPDVPSQFNPDTLYVYNRGGTLYQHTGTTESAIATGSAVVDVTGTPVAGQMPYWSDANTLASDPSFTRASAGVYSLTTLTATTSLISPLATLTAADAGTATPSYPLVLTHTTSGTAAAGFGVGTSYILEDAAGANQTVGALSLNWTGVVADSENTSFSFYTQPDAATPGTLTEVFRVGHNASSAINIWHGVPSANSSILHDATNGSVTYCSAVSTSVNRRYMDTTLATYRPAAENGSSYTWNAQALNSATTTAFKFDIPTSATSVTAGTECLGVDFSLDQTRSWATGALALQREFLVRAPTYAFTGASTLSLAYTADIAGAPIAGTNATITALAGLRVQGGVVVGAAALGTGDVTGFLYLPTCAGAPSGTPEAHTGTVPMVFDSTNNRLYIYDGSWLGLTTPGVWT